MVTLMDDERIQFYLRHHSEIREWAAIERDVISATKDLLGGVQADIDERLAQEGDALTSRLDEGRYERILIRRALWPAAVAVALEWEQSVDPFGSSLPKYGILFLNREPSLDRARLAIQTEAKNSTLRDSFKIPGDRVWPAVRRLPKSVDWWKAPAAWTAEIAEGMTELWQVAAPIIDGALHDPTARRAFESG